MDPTPVLDITTIMTEGMQVVQGTLMSMIGGVMPYIVAMLTVTIGVPFIIRFFKKSAK